MSEGFPDSEFETWFGSIVGELASERRVEVRPWFLRLYEMHGAVTGDVAKTSWELDKLASVERAIALTLSDLHRTTLWRPDVNLSDWHDDIAITVEGHTRVPAAVADPWDEHEILCQVADHVQEDISEAYSEVWPTCQPHGAGLHAEVRSGKAVWWCRVGDHAVAAIGALGA